MEADGQWQFIEPIRITKSTVRISLWIWIILNLEYLWILPISTIRVINSDGMECDVGKHWQIDRNSGEISKWVEQSAFDEANEHSKDGSKYGTNEFTAESK